MEELRAQLVALRKENRELARANAEPIEALVVLQGMYELQEFEVPFDDAAARTTKLAKSYADLLWAGTSADELGELPILTTAQAQTHVE